ncbi:MAG: hypothetical protein CMF31_01620 [Kordiimonas sp.]|nr:hypothetical protein [Kordiimonas sp.]
MDIEFFQVFILLGAGCIAGFVGGLFGVGGGFIVVPVLFNLFQHFGISQDISMHLAVGSSLAIILPTSAMSCWSHHKRGSVDFGRFRKIAPACFIGVILGAIVASYLSAVGLASVFGITGIAMGLWMLMGKNEKRQQTPSSSPLVPWIGGSGIGMLSSMVGIGGGAYSVMVLSFMGAKIHLAVGTASAMALVVTLPGAIGFMVSGWQIAGLPPFSLGYVNLMAVACIIPASIVFSPLGVRTAHYFSPVLLQRLFALFMIGVSIRMLYSVYI